MAQFNLGYIYYCGLFVLRNIDKAIYYLSLAAKQYHSDAQFYLGSIYYEGLYVTHDIEKAIHYFKEASCFNHVCLSFNFLSGFFSMFEIIFRALSKKL